MKAGFLEKLIERLGRIGPEEVQNYFLRLAQEKGFLETVFNAIQEGIIVTDSKGSDHLSERCGLQIVRTGGSGRHRKTARRTRSWSRLGIAYSKRRTAQS